MLTFHPLTVVEHRTECDDAVCIGLAVPEHLAESFRFEPGQHIGVRAQINGKEVRRTYSICSERGGKQLHIGVRVQDEGGMSHHLARHVRLGDVLDIMPPTGRFIATQAAGAGHSYCAFASGSGITPILGIMRDRLAAESDCRFHLFYGNRSMSTVMFAEDLLALKDRYLERLSLTFVLSREEQEVELCNGRLDRDKVTLLGKSLFDPAAVDAYFLCGPGSMLADVKQGLVDLGVLPERIHMERFNVRTGAPRATPAVAPATQADVQVTVAADGRQRHFGMKKSDVTVLEAAEAAGLSLPYSCRAGVCSTCRAKVTRGAVSMQTNYALEPWELEQGFVLCCQAIPTTSELDLNYDER